jgi:hypothetical protein
MIVPGAVMIATLLAAASPAPATSPLSNPISQAFPDRAALLQARISNDASAKLLAPGQDVLLRAELAAAQNAYARHDFTAPYMLDEIDRQLAIADHVLGRPENGSALVVHVGANIVVAMHDQYTYTVANTDPTSLEPRVGVAWARGVQGGFTAAQPGTAILSFTPAGNVLPNQKQPVVFAIVVLPQRPL